MCDHETCKEDEFETESAEQTLELEQKREQNDLENIDVRAEHDAPLLDTIIKAIQASSPDWVNISESVHRLPPQDKRKLANETEAIRIIINSQLSSNSRDKMALLDDLFVNISIIKLDKCENNANEDPTTSLLLDMILARFGVAVGSSRVRDTENKKIVKKYLEMKKEREKLTEKAWTVEAAKHLYQTYQKVPQSTLDMIICVVTFNTCLNDKKKIEGETDNQEAIYKLDYNNKNVEKSVEEINRNETNSSTAKHNAFDHTNLHELGHILDQKFHFSSDKGENSFRSISEWNEHNTNSPKELMQKFLDFQDEKPNFNSDEEIIAIETSVFIYDQEYKSTTQNLKSFIIIDNIEKNVKKSSLKEESITIIYNSSFIKNLKESFACLTPWNKDTIPNMTKIRMHQPFPDALVWYSFNANAHKENKISKYQFSSPSEEFAEIFSTYYEKLSKTRTTEQRKTLNNENQYFLWFSKNVIPLIDMENNDVP